MAGWEMRVIEVKTRMMGHTYSFHNAAGTEIRGDGKGDDLRRVEDVEAIVKDDAGTFAGESAAPMGDGEPPADFDSRVGDSGDGERDGLSTDHADEGAILNEFGGEEAVAAPVVVGSEAFDGCVALFAG